MKNRYLYGLFLVLLAAAVIAWLYGNTGDRAAEEYEYGADGEYSYHDSMDNKINNKMNNENEALQVQNAELVIDSDATCIYEDIDKSNGNITLSEVKTPDEFIGKTRKQLEEILKGKKSFRFESQHLELFSGKKLKILRIYDSRARYVNNDDKEEKTSGYYIMLQDGSVYIFEADKKTIYYKTDLVYEKLPPRIQKELIAGKYMDTEIKVYHFLESYSS